MLDKEQIMKLRNSIANQVGNDLYQATIYWDSEWQEYQVHLSINGNKIRAATYHTEWHDDAIGTAYTMVKLPPPDKKS